jgi:hypothetical protein
MKQITVVGSTSVWQIDDADGSSRFLYTSGMQIDADGAYRAYHPDSKSGLDRLANAGHPGNWWGIVTDNGQRDGNPIVQGDADPAPGFYVSSTSLSDKTKALGDPLRYVDSESIPYLVLPRQVIQATGMRLGDFAVVVRGDTANPAFAIFADGGPAGKIGEGSIALADALGIPSSPRAGGTTKREVTVLLFPGSGNHTPRSSDDIESVTNALFANWGGGDRLTEVLDQLPQPFAPFESDVRGYEVTDRPTACELE